MRIQPIYDEALLLKTTKEVIWRHLGGRVRGYDAGKIFYTRGQNGDSIDIDDGELSGREATIMVNLGWAKEI